jgi:hypothetical protein
MANVAPDHGRRPHCGGLLQPGLVAGIASDDPSILLTAGDGAEPLPIAILSFDRPRYLKKVLLSLRRQIGHSQPVVLFQDGAWNPHSRQLKGNPWAVAECIGLFRRVIPWGTVAVSDVNLGIAANYERAEQEMFGRLRAKHALFLEDDMVLSPNYLTVTRMLLDLAKHDRRISYVSAYGNFWAEPPEQEARRGELIHMHENWGFAMTCEAWLAERPFRREYLALLHDTDYTERNHEAIIRFYREHGWNTLITSQDSARWIASLELGRVRLTTFPCHARNIGRRGVHSTGAIYDQSGISGAHFFTGPLCAPEPPTDAQIAKWIATERARFTTEPKAFYAGHLTGAAGI